MHVKLGATVLDKNHVEVGKVDRVVIDRRPRQIVQIVARQGHIDAKQHIIDRDMVDRVDESGNVHLKLDAKEVAHLREYYSVNYTPPNHHGEIGWVDWTQAVGTPLGGPDVSITDATTRYTSLAENVVVVTKGMDVQDKDFEKFGEMEDIEFDQQAAVTGFTVRSGGRFRQTQHYFKVEQVAGVGNNYIRVNLSGEEARATPARASSG